MRADRSNPSSTNAVDNFVDNCGSKRLELSTGAPRIELLNF
jgi:hypothetical protein